MIKKAEKENLKISSIIGEGTIIEGDYNAKGAVRMDGCIQGDVTITGILVMGSTAKVTGNVTADSAVIGGELIGNLTVENKVELTESAKVLGNIKTSIIVIDENAVFQGQCDMNQEVPEKGNKKNKRLLKAERKSAGDAIRQALREAEVEESQEENKIVTSETSENIVQE